MPDTQEHDKLVGLTMDEAQVILLALYIADTQKVKTSFDFEKLARLGGYGSGQSAVVMFSHARRKLDSFIPVNLNKRKRDDGDVDGDDYEDLSFKPMRCSSDKHEPQIGTELFDPMDSTFFKIKPMI